MSKYLVINDEDRSSQEMFNSYFNVQEEEFNFFGPIERVNILVGANNSGKSRFLRGIIKTENGFLRSCLKIGKRKAPEKDQLCSANTKKSLTDGSSQK